ncbi:DUF5134 domain-containing protein [Streptomyces platensis]|uniref:DUF5134 domain-containing protein n=1 Tax=Streptomyces platensis TaxID=58346 RepID=UPI001F453D65|nr:DUF5134 domain-containing protein [Streptomyces platensis]MCF3146229.1 DUF5134 domain-containing protein [Streptomyces platensis]
MHGPVWVGWLLVLLGAAAGAYCLVRARSGPAAQRGEARGEGLMALGMAAMAWPAAPPSWSPWLFTAVFGAAGLWALAHRHLHHAVGALAMAYMALAMVVPASQQAGHTGQIGQMAPMGQAGGTGPMAHAVPVTGAGVLPACRVAMGIGMLAMLLAL